MTGERNNRATAVELFLLSAVSLYLELLIIRWMSADFRAFTVFKTFPLATCFIGLGLGYAKRNSKAFAWAPAVLMLCIAILQTAEFFGLREAYFPSISILQWNYVTVSWDVWGGFVLALFALLAGPFAIMFVLGGKLGQLFDELEPLPAYCINIGGSIVGGILASVSAFLGWGPAIMLIPCALALLYYSPQRIVMKTAFAVGAIGLAFWNPTAEPNLTTYWSPYQRLEVYPFTVAENADPKKSPDAGVCIKVNNSFYQYGINLDPKFVEAKDMPTDLRDVLRSHARNYDVVYRVKQHPQDVLVIGAGSGNDVAAALRNGASHVDAVDIDPMIIDIGKRMHPERPYASDKVTVICDDAHNYLLHCQKKYDLIVFAGLDSHTVTGNGGSARLDNYIYTRENLARALDCLRPDGLMQLSFFANWWQYERLYATLTAAAGYKPLSMYDSQPHELLWSLFLTGPMVKAGNVQLAQNVAPFVQTFPKGQLAARVLTDDWPFIYVRPERFDFPYLGIVALILVVSGFLTRHVLAQGKGQPALWQMFFLGAAFFLMELQAISRLALIYGTTWITSAVVINGVLIMILIANVGALKMQDKLNKLQQPVYMFLFASLAASYFLPIHNIMLNCGTVAGDAIITVVTLLPVLAASLIFASAFSRTKNASLALGFNMFGAVLGALLEYASNFTGINALLGVVFALYLASYIAHNMASKSTAVPAVTPES